MVTSCNPAYYTFFLGEDLICDQGDYTSFLVKILFVIKESRLQPHLNVVCGWVNPLPKSAQTKLLVCNPIQTEFVDECSTCKIGLDIMARPQSCSSGVCRRVVLFARLQPR